MRRDGAHGENVTCETCMVCQTFPLLLASTDAEKCRGTTRPYNEIKQKRRNHTEKVSTSTKNEDPTCHDRTGNTPTKLKDIETAARNTERLLRVPLPPSDSQCCTAGAHTFVTIPAFKGHRQPQQTCSNCHTCNPARSDKEPCSYSDTQGPRPHRCQTVSQRRTRT